MRGMSSLRLQLNTREASEKSRNDNMILFFSNINEWFTFNDFQKKAGRLFYGTTGSRHESFFSAPSVLADHFSASLRFSLYGERRLVC